MSYDFQGSFKLDRPLAPEHKAYVEAFARTRRMQRDAEVTARRQRVIRIRVDQAKIREILLGAPVVEGTIEP